MTFAPALARAMMLLAKWAWPPLAVANSMEAPGARSCTSCAIPRPSSVPPGESSRMVVATGRSPLAISPAMWVLALALVLKLSEITPILTPVPSNP